MHELDILATTHGFSVWVTHLGNNWYRVPVRQVSTVLTGYLGSSSAEAAPLAPQPASNSQIVSKPPWPGLQMAAHPALWERATSLDATYCVRVYFQSARWFQKRREVFPLPMSTLALYSHSTLSEDRRMFYHQATMLPEGSGSWYAFQPW